MTTWHTVATAADHVRAASGSVIRQAVKSGDLPASRYGKTDIRIKEDDLDAWLESKPWEPKQASA